MNGEESELMRIYRQPSTIQIMVVQKQKQNVEHFNYFGSMITNDARWTREVKSSIAMAKAAFKKEIFSAVN